MDKKKVNALVLESYTDDNLDPKKVNKICALISKSDLKKYINGLKLAEKQRNVIISSPINNQDSKKFMKLFPHKKIIFRKDPSLMLGMQIIDDDMVYEFTLKNSLDRIVSYIEKNYD